MTYVYKGRSWGYEVDRKDWDAWFRRVIKTLIEHSANQECFKVIRIHSMYIPAPMQSMKLRDLAEQTGKIYNWEFKVELEYLPVVIFERRQIVVWDAEMIRAIGEYLDSEEKP